MGDKETAMGDFFRALADIVDSKGGGSFQDAAIKFAAALGKLAEKEPSTAKVILKCIPEFWRALKKASE